MLVRSAIPRRAHRSSSSLSFAQERLWFLHHLAPQTSLHNRPMLLRLAGPLDTSCLTETLNRLAIRHEILRTVFVAEHGEPRARVLAEPQHEVRVADLERLTESQRATAQHAAMSAAVGEPFDLSDGPLMRARLLRLAADEHLLLIVTHHIIFDGWSSTIFTEDLHTIYHALVRGAEPDLAALPVQYADFAEWQRRQYSEHTQAQDLAYWKAHLTDAATSSPLPADRTQRSSGLTQCGSHAVVFDRDLIGELAGVGREQGATLFMTLLSAFAALLYRYSDRTDFVCGTLVAARRHRELERLVGLFVNLLPLRLSLTRDLTFRTLLRHTRSVVLGGLAHQHLPFQRIAQAMPNARDFLRPSSVRVVFQLRNYPQPQFGPAPLTITALEWPEPASEFDLAVAARETTAGLECQFQYDRDAFDADTICRLTGHFQRVIANCAANPDQRLDHIDPLTRAERRQYVEWNQTRAAFDDRPLYEQFAAAARRSQNHTAFFCDDERITYAQLEAAADRIATRLQAAGVVAETPIGIFLDRSFDCMAALLGTLKAGAACVPLDPAYPKALLSFIIGDTATPIVLTNRRHVALLPETNTCTLYVDELASDGRGDEPRAAVPISSEHAAFIIYTSGSTASPKGVIALHRGAANRFAWMWTAFPFQPDDVCCQKTSLNFVDSIWEVFGPLLRGVPSVIIPDDSVRDPRRLIETVARHAVTRLVVVPSLLDALLDAGPDVSAKLATLRLVISSGEVLHRDLVHRCHRTLPHARLLNLYGSSETGGDVTWYDATDTRDDDRPVPIGRPIANMAAYVVDRNLQQVPIGVRGELYVSGPGLARGYAHDSALNAERFIANPFSPDRWPTLFKTGDVARYRADGNLEFLGRVDRQIKIRGCRIEPDQIEAVLHAHPAVREAVVTATADASSPATSRLTAYVAPTRAGTLSAPELRQFLRQRLPGMLVPSEIVVADALPRTPNGKLDAIACASRGGNPASTIAEAEQDIVELTLRRIWEELLSVRPISLDADFFDLGGHSLLAAQLFSRIERMFGKRLALGTLFEAPTVRQQAALIRKHRDGLASSIVVVQPKGSQPPLFCMAGVGGNVVTYRDLSRRLGTARPCYAVQSYGLTGPNPAASCVEEMAARHVDEILGAQPEGPYHLCGTSFGGLVAYEIAQQLTARGREVALLAMFDTYGPGYPRLLPTTTRVRWSIYRFARRVELHIRNVLISSPADKIAYVRAKSRLATQRITHRLQAVRAAMRDPIPEYLRELEAANFRARYGYQPKPYPGAVILFRAARQPFGIHPDPALGWNGMAGGGLEIYEVPGSHGAIIHEPLVGSLAAHLAACLERAERRQQCSMAECGVASTRTRQRIYDGTLDQPID